MASATKAQAGVSRSSLPVSTLGAADLTALMPPLMEGSGVELERMLWAPQQGSIESLREMAGKRSLFHREFGITPAGLFKAEKHPMGFPTATVAVYEIPDLSERAAPAPPHFGAGLVSKTAHFVLLEPKPSNIQVISQQFGSASVGIVRRYSPLPFGLVIEGDRLFRANEVFDDTLQHALETARMRKQSTDGYVVGLAKFLRDVGCPEGSCLAENYVVAGGRVMLRSTAWREAFESLPVSGASNVVDKMLTEKEKVLFRRVFSEGREDGRFLTG